MKKLTSILLVIFTALALISCSSAPVTGRKQLILVKDSDIMKTSFQQYDDFLAQNKLSTDKQATEMVKRTGDKIKTAVEKYYKDQGMSSELKGYKWEFNLVEDDAINAWAMPGGKVVVYTGLLKVATNENELAVVMGHEVAHAVARHGSERLSQGMIAEFGGKALNEALKDKPDETQKIWMGAYGAGANVGVMLPFSRLHESEADHLGIIFMSMAGYDPSVAVTFWEKMSKAGGKGQLEILSTHPSDDTRIKDLKKAIPEVKKKYYKK